MQLPLYSSGMDKNRFSPHPSHYIQCSVCLRRLQTGLTCERCRAVYYCSEKCRDRDAAGSDSDADSHQFWCEKALTYRMDCDIGSFPFSFAAETTGPSFTASKYESFLKHHGVIGQGLWAREGKSSVYEVIPFGELRLIEDPYVLPSESIILDGADVVPLAEPLRSWSEFYSWRGFRLDSPIAILLQWPLTLYHVLKSCLPIDYPGVAKSSKYCIHCVGAGKEADLTAVFSELTVLLPDDHFDIHLVGPDISQAADGRSFECGNSRLSGTLHRGLYHELWTCLPAPYCVIGFNAGLVAYCSWIESIRLLAKSKVPAYFTEYCWKSYELTRVQVDRVISRSGVPSLSISDGQLNPFRSPIRIHDPQTEIPAYSNAILFHFEYGADGDHPKR